jgi:hypothetical protein
MEKKDGVDDAFRDEFFGKLIDEIPCGAALHRIICDAAGTAVDYVTTRVNPAFKALLGVSAETVVGFKASEHLSPEELRHWLRIFAPVALEGKTITYTMYSVKNKQAFSGTAICPERGMFFVMFVRSEDWNPEYMHLPMGDQT